MQGKAQDQVQNAVVIEWRRANPKQLLDKEMQPRGERRTVYFILIGVIAR